MFDELLHLTTKATQFLFNVQHRHVLLDFLKLMNAQNFVKFVFFRRHNFMLSITHDHW